MPLPQQTITAKRDGKELSADEISAFVRGISDQSITEGQVAAFAMAVYFQGMTTAETVALTEAMRDSGRVLTWDRDRFDGPILDKHSTGGVGDKVSLILGPILAAAGAYVPMISGRGLGHTGGTLDKLDSIPGYQSQPDIALFEKTVAETGCAIIGQTDDLAPADRRFYSIRDITGTVPSIPLITASILSKKLAAGTDALVMDIKTGNGAFANTPAMAEELGRSIVSTAKGAGLKTSALITNMNEILGNNAGNSLEVIEAVDFLKEKTFAPGLSTVIYLLCHELFQHGGLSASMDDSFALLREQIQTGAAAEVFQKMVAGLGGPTDLVEKPSRYFEAAPIVRPVFPDRNGYLSETNVTEIGMMIVAMGGGRRRPEDAIDPRVGLTEMAKIGDEVSTDTPLAVLHAKDLDDWDAAAHKLRQSVQISDEMPLLEPTLLGNIESVGIVE